MRAARLGRRLGLDRNPLRPRTDKVAACLAALLIAVFLAGAPVLAAVAVVWAGRAAAAEQWAARSWRPGPALLGPAAVPPALELSGRCSVRGPGSGTA